MSLVVAGETEHLFRSSIADRKVVKFLEEFESFKMVEGVDEIGFLFIDNVVRGSNVFELTVCLISSIQC